VGIKKEKSVLTLRDHKVNYLSWLFYLAPAERASPSSSRQIERGLRGGSVNV